ncbi:hypothetical protein M885DRAFT_620058 [Pelagophyceae sp. CCMP2097]|nr:hypothetical protein M885DRAFT_620058 [Pelagophyceae sp. CCMP2097]
MPSSRLSGLWLGNCGMRWTAPRPLGARARASGCCACSLVASTNSARATPTARLAAGIYSTASRTGRCVTRSGTRTRAIAHLTAAALVAIRGQFTERRVGRTCAWQCVRQRSKSAAVLARRACGLLASARARPLAYR